MFSSFTVRGEIIGWMGDGECLQVEPWGDDSVRVRASKQHKIFDTDWALLSKNQLTSIGRPKVTVSQDGSVAELVNGALTVRLTIEEAFNAGAGGIQSRCSLTFLDDAGKTLFREMPSGGSLNLKARQYEPVGGGALSAAASFLAPNDECLYGMGEYQQDLSLIHI